MKNYEKAEIHFKKAYKLKPDFKEGLMEYAEFLLRTKRLDRTLELVEDIKDDESLRFDYYLIKGRALQEMEKYSEAIDNFLEGNKIYNSDIRLLNGLGYCFYKIGQNERALNTLKASLHLNSAQEEVKKLIEKIEGKINRSDMFS